MLYQHTITRRVVNGLTFLSGQISDKHYFAVPSLGNKILMYIRAKRRCRTPGIEQTMEMKTDVVKTFIFIAHYFLENRRRNANLIELLNAVIVTTYK